MMPKRLCHPLAFLFALALLATAADRPAAAQGAPPAPSGANDTKSTLGDLPDSVNPIDYTSADGQFRATFPTGCARLYTKMNMAEDGSTDVDVRLVFVTCERANTANEGCLVNARLGTARGVKGKEAIDLVLKEVRALLDGYGVVPARQTPIRRDFGPHGIVEGIDILAHPEFGKGDVWIRGLLRGDDMYLVVAWKAAGGLLDDPEYGYFFQSFVPWVE